MTKARDIADFKFENIADTGTEGTKVASGTTAQRGTTAGQLRYNTTSNRFEGKNATGVTEIFASPSVSSVDDVEVDSEAGGNQTFIITGANFSAGDEVSFVGNDGTTIIATSTTVDSATQITAVIAKSSFVNAKEPYNIKVTSSNNTSGTLNNIINVDNPLSWTTASGNLGTINHNVNATHFTLVATDPDGDTVTYSEVGNNLSASGLSLNNSTGEISGDPTDQALGASTTYSFTVRATANSKTTDRNFNIIVRNPPEYIIATGGNISYDGDYKIHTMPYSSTENTDVTTNFVVTDVGVDATYGDKIWYLILAGGGESGQGAGNGKQGRNSTAFGLTAYGGGAGSQNGGATGDGGSGGGGRGDGSVAAGSGVAGQGNSGGAGYDPHPEAAGGGGGAGGAGGTGATYGGAGGVGLQNSITGSAVYYAGGGAGSSSYTDASIAGGAGGGGTGNGGFQTGSSNLTANTAGTDGLGGGAGGSMFNGGGGAGGLLTNGATATYNFTVTEGTYPCVVGGGAGSGDAITKGGAGTIIIRYKYQ